MTNQEAKEVPQFHSPFISSHNDFFLPSLTDLLKSCVYFNDVFILETNANSTLPPVFSFPFFLRIYVHLKILIR